MSGQFPMASYPTSIWDGTLPTRTSVTEKRNPDKFDYDRIVAELIAVQTAVGAGESGIGGRVSELEEDYGSMATNIQDLGTDLDKISDSTTRQVIDSTEPEVSIFIPLNNFNFPTVGGLSGVEYNTTYEVFGINFPAPTLEQDETFCIFPFTIPTGLVVVPNGYLKPVIHFYLPAAPVDTADIICFSIKMFMHFPTYILDNNPNQTEIDYFMTDYVTNPSLETAGTHQVQEFVDFIVAENCLRNLSWGILRRKVVDPLFSEHPYAGIVSVIGLELRFKQNKFGIYTPPN